MERKKKPPIKFFVIVLLVSLLFAYLLSGAFARGHGIDRIAENFVYVFLHPLENWISEYTLPLSLIHISGQECEQNRERIYAALQEISQDKINHIIQKVEASTRLIQKHTRIIAENNDRMKQYVNPSASEKSENIQTEVSQKATIRPVRKQIQEKNRKIVLSK